MSHLDVESPLFEKKPHVWIQWKGTDVCADIHCECGAHLHFDGDFMYFFRCPYCETVWETGTHIAIYKVKPEDVVNGSMVKIIEKSHDPAEDNK